MGSWGPGNFDNDVAMDWYLIHFAKPLIESLRTVMIRKGVAGRAGLEPDESEPLLCKLEVLTALHRHVRSVLPPKEEISQWRRRYLRVYDEFTSSDGCRWDKEFIRERRLVVIKSFDAAIRRAESDRYFDGTHLDELEARESLRSSASADRERAAPSRPKRRKR